jgi:hypothetical protein
MNRMKLSATSENIGAPRTISFVMPVICVIFAGMARCGFNRECHSSTTWWLRIFTAPISVIVPALAIGLDLGIGRGDFVHQRLDQLALRLVDRDDADGSIDPPPHESRCPGHDRSCFQGIAALAGFVPAIGDPLTGNSEVRIVQDRARIDEQPVVIEFAVGIGDQRLMTRAVVNSQHSHRTPAAPTQFENGLLSLKRPDQCTMGQVEQKLARGLVRDILVDA